MKKADVLDLVEAMPDELDHEELIYRIYLRHKLAEAEADVAAGRVYTQEEVIRITSEWLK